MLDTNVALDLLVFGDARVQPVRDVLARGDARWICTAAMRDEFARVLAYPQLAGWLARASLDAAALVVSFEDAVGLVEAAPPAPVSCSDPDDQKFVDLAVAYRAVLLSRDAEVLKLARRLEPLGVTAAAVLA